MLSIATSRFIVGVIGNVITAGLFLCPCLTIHKIRKAKSIQEFSPDPYIVTVFNCLMWMLYGLPFVHKDNILVLTINTFGLIVELIYVAFFLYYSNNSAKRRKIWACLGIEAVAFVGVFLCTLFAFHEEQKRSLFIGLLCVVFNIGMYFSPLTIVFKVLKTKSVEFMPFWLTIFNLGNGGIWLTYALLRFDLFIVIPNGLGMLSGFFQLGLYAYFHKNKSSLQEGQLPKQTVPGKQIQMESIIIKN